LGLATLAMFSFASEDARAAQSVRAEAVEAAGAEARPVVAVSPDAPPVAAVAPEARPPAAASRGTRPTTSVVRASASASASPSSKGLEDVLCRVARVRSATVRPASKSSGRRAKKNFFQRVLFRMVIK
jgi:hypothetical protein